MGRSIRHRGGVAGPRCRGNLFLIAALLFFAMVHVPETYGADVQTLRVVTLQPPTNSLAMEMLKGFEAVTQKTRGSVKFQIHYGVESGYKPQEYIYVLGKGLVDMAMVGHANSSLSYPWLNINGIFFLLPNFKAREPVMNALRPMFDEFFREQGIIPLSYVMYLDAWSVLYSTRNITSFSDFKGMLVRIYDPLSIALTKSLGATPVSLQKSEVYMGLQKRTIDSAITDSGAAKDMRLSEVCKYMLLLSPNFNANLIGMSKVTWEKLSTDQQNIFRNVFTSWEKNFWAKANDPAMQAESLKYARTNGMAILEPPADMKTAIPSIRKEQIQFYLSKGGDRGKKAMDILESMLLKLGK